MFESYSTSLYTAAAKDKRGRMEIVESDDEYSAQLSLPLSAEILSLVGALGVLAYGALLFSYFFVANIKAQHPAADLIVWHAGCGFMANLGLVVSFAVQNMSRAALSDQCFFLSSYNQFFMLASSAWYLMLTLDLLVALVNPWMGYSCKAWAYHTIVWSVSAASALIIYRVDIYGLSVLNVCWVRRTPEAHEINRANWVLLYGAICTICTVSLAVLLFATFRFARRQLDVTYRAKRRNLLQYYRYWFVYTGYWTACGALYYSSYRNNFQGRLAHECLVALTIVFGSYPLFLFLVWVVNTEMYQNRQRENTLTSAERDSEALSKTEHFSTALRKDLMRYTTAGIRSSLKDIPDDSSLRSPLLRNSRHGSVDRNVAAALSLLHMEDTDSTGLYHEKKRLATTVYNGEYRYYEKLGFTDYAPKIFHNLREVCGIDNARYEQSFADTLLERASEGKSGMLFYFTSDRKYLVKTMTKKEHSFLLKILPLYHQYVLREPNTLLCRFLGCHSMQLPVGWNKMFFVVMENVFPDGPVDERYDLKGVFHQSNFSRFNDALAAASTPPSSSSRLYQRQSPASQPYSHEEEEEERQMQSPIQILTEDQPLLRTRSRTSLRYDTDFVSQRAALHVNSATRANLLAQLTSDCGFLQELGIMDYSCLLGIRRHKNPVDSETLDNLAHNAVVSTDKTCVYYLGFVDILQSYNLGWKLQHLFLSSFLDKHKITALPPAEYALRFLSFIHEYLLRDAQASSQRSYGSILFQEEEFSPPA